MRAWLVSIFVIVCLTLALGCQHAQTYPVPTRPDVVEIVNYNKIATEFVQSYFTSEEAYSAIQAGVKRDYNFDLKEIKVGVEVIGKEHGEIVVVGVRVYLTMFCTDPIGIHYRAVVDMFCIVGIQGKEVIGIELVATDGIKILDGWNGKSA